MDTIRTNKTHAQLLDEWVKVQEAGLRDNRWGECRRFHGRVTSSRLDKLRKLEAQMNYLDQKKGIEK